MHHIKFLRRGIRSYTDDEHEQILETGIMGTLCAE